MNEEKKIEFIDEISNAINYYVDEHDLFSGGCCYAAYLIAYCLDKVGIKYKTAIFQFQDVLNARSFNKAINGDGVAHVAIEVKIDNIKIFIGKCDGIYRYFDVTKQKYKVRHYRSVSPKMLLSVYRGRFWNKTYDTYYNELLCKDLNKILEKYV